MATLRYSHRVRSTLKSIQPKCLHHLNLCQCTNRASPVELETECSCFVGAIQAHGSIKDAARGQSLRLSRMPWSSQPSLSQRSLSQRSSRLRLTTSLRASRSPSLGSSASRRALPPGSPCHPPIAPKGSASPLSCWSCARVTRRRYLWKDMDIIRERLKVAERLARGQPHDKADD